MPCRCVRLVLLVPVVVVLAGCAGVGPDVPAADPCAGATEAPDGTMIPRSEPYWTRTTGFDVVADAEERLALLPLPSWRIAGIDVEPVLTGFSDADGEYMERHWACRPWVTVDVQAGDVLRVMAPGATIEASAGYQHPDGRDIWQGSQWSSEDQLERTLIASSDPDHDEPSPLAAQDGTWSLFVFTQGDEWGTTQAVDLEFHA